MKMHRKQISQNEIDTIVMLNELLLLDYTLIAAIEDETLVEYEGYHIGRSQWDINKLYREVVQPFHNIKFDKFGPGIYSFWGSEITQRKDYRYHLLEELKNMGCENADSVKGKVYKLANKTLNQLIMDGKEIKEFSLLHGDLYNGNILVRDNRYAVIDFEYVTFGPPLLEWTFLLFWDAIIESDEGKKVTLFETVSRDIEIIKKNGIIEKSEIRLIFDLYLPVMLCFVLHNCENYRYDRSSEVESAVCDFWINEYYKLRGELYE